MYIIGVCDDGIPICAFFEKIILAYTQKIHMQTEVECFYSGEDLKAFLEAGNHLDILFLDIELLKMNGIQVAQYIRNEMDNHSMQIIFISGISSYAQSLFQIQPMDFLIKPVSDVQIRNTLQLAIRLSGGMREQFSCKVGQDRHYIPYQDILYFASAGRKVTIILLSDRGTDDSCWDGSFYGKLKGIKEELPDFFLQIHQSYIINTRYVEQYQYDRVNMMGGSTLPISKALRQSVRHEILRIEG